MIQHRHHPLLDALAALFPPDDEHPPVTALNETRVDVTHTDGWLGPIRPLETGTV